MNKTYTSTSARSAASTPSLGDKLLLRGIHLSLTEAMRATLRTKADRLLRHEPRIDRIRIDVELDKTAGHQALFVAKGHIEIGGPDLLAAVAANDAYKAIDLLVDKLDRLLGKRAKLFKSRRHAAPKFAEVLT
jgi:putative sigma-54 modulation protein